MGSHRSYSLPLSRTCNSKVVSPITISKCSYVIASLKTSSQGLDRIPTHMLKNVSDHLVDPSTKNIHSSFPTGTVPSSMKTACITPIHKSGHSYEANSYRPVSVIPLFAIFVGKMHVFTAIKFHR